MPHEGQRGRRATNYVQRQVLSWREVYRNEELKKKRKKIVQRMQQVVEGRRGGGVALLACSAF